MVSQKESVATTTQAVHQHSDARHDDGTEIDESEVLIYPLMRLNIHGGADYGRCGRYIRVADVPDPIHVAGSSNKAKTQANENGWRRSEALKWRHSVCQWGEGSLGNQNIVIPRSETSTS